MKMVSIRMKVWVGLLIIELFWGRWFSECEGCLKQESDALLQLKAHFGNLQWSNGWLNGTNCCQWENVVCNSTTSRVVQLDLYRDGSPVTGGIVKNLNMSDFYAFEDLRILDLRGNNIAACVESEGSGKPFRLSNLQRLDLSENLLNDTSNILSCLSGLSSLKILHMGDNNLTVDNGGKESLSWPTNLEVLDLSSNKFNDDILSSLSILQHLKSLDLSDNYLEGSVNISGLCTLSELEILVLSGNKNISNFEIAEGTNISLGSMKELYLDNLNLDLSKSHKPLRAFSYVRMLSLFNYKFRTSFVAGALGELENLEDLSLSGSYIENELFKSIGALASLRFLSVGYCKINGTLLMADWSNLQRLKELKLHYNEFKGPLPITGWFKLKKLEELEITENKFTGLLPLSFVNMTSLQSLDLSGNSFDGNIASNIVTLPSLEYLDISRNHFEVPTSLSFLANHSNLKFFYGAGNKLIADIYPTSQTWVPKFQLQEFNLSSITGASSLPPSNFLIHQYNLSMVDLTGNKIETEFPKWLLENNTKITSLILRNCSLRGHFQLPSHPIPKIKFIDVSNNAITGQFPGNNISSIFPTLFTLDMSGNAITGSLCHEFGQIKSIAILDLSDNHLSGEIPANISMGESDLTILKLSNNNLDGPVCSTFTMNNSLQYLRLDGNRFSGRVEGCFKNFSDIVMLDLSNNHFVGKIPTLGSSPFLNGLSLANNHLEGTIPGELFELPELTFLDLSENNLSGSIPSFASSYLSYIDLSGNKLSGLATTMFSRNSTLNILDLSNNEITSTLQPLISHLSELSILMLRGYYFLISNVSELSILLLRGNHFFGQIPDELCQLKNLSILDLSYNKFSGPLPNCLNKISFGANEVADIMPFYKFGFDGISYVVDKQVDFTTKRRSYTYKGNILRYMSGMDLSYNELNGSIPLEVGNLMYIRAVNLSHNHLTGEIPTTFSNLKNIESLDLSFNKLSGKIPPQLIELTSLEVFSLAYNNLLGATPERKGQFITFDESSYDGNPLLCGPPLNKSCTANNGSPSEGNEDENDGFMDMQFFYISFLVSYASILLVMATVLYINPHWRRAWFYFIEHFITHCYYFVVDNFHR